MGRSTYPHLSVVLLAEQVRRRRVGGLEAEGDAGRDFQHVTVTEQETFALLMHHVCIPLGPEAGQVPCIHEWLEVVRVLLVERHRVEVNVSARHMAVQYLVLTENKSVEYEPKAMARCEIKGMHTS